MTDHPVHNDPVHNPDRPDPVEAAYITELGAERALGYREALTHVLAAFDVEVLTASVREDEKAGFYKAHNLVRALGRDTVRGDGA